MQVKEISFDLNPGPGGRKPRGPGTMRGSTGGSRGRATGRRSSMAAGIGTRPLRDIAGIEGRKKNVAENQRLEKVASPVPSASITQRSGPEESAALGSIEKNQKLDRIEASVASLMEKLQTLLPAEDGDELIPDTQKLKDLLSIDERIARLEQMIENLSNFVHKLPSQLPTKTPGESRSIIKKRKIKYVPVDLTNTEPLIYPRFYTIKLPAEQKQSINPYRLK